MTEPSPKRAHWPFLPTLVGLALLLVASVVISPMVGDEPISLARALKGPMLPDDTGTMLHNTDYLILMTLRVPRMVFGLVVGAALALAGAVFQALLRNDLATPYTLGVSGGATFGALLTIQAAGMSTASIAGSAMIPPAALLGGGAAVAIILMMASRAPGPERMATLLLAGVTMNLMFGAGIQIIQYRANPFEVYSMVRWMMGGLYEINLWVSAFLALPVLIGFVILMSQAQALNVMALGDATAVHLGFDAARTRLIGIITGSVITALVVAWAGPIGFVGLIIPHALRRLVGPDHRKLLPCVLLGGAAFLVFCDAAGRVLGGKLEFPVGIVTACVGGPFFLWVLFRRGVRG